MTPDQAQSVVARCLTDPDFLLRAHERSRSTSHDGQTPEDVAAGMLGECELERLRRFRGFITKVKHNALRRHVPATLGLMGALGVELAFFCEFSPAYVAARRDGPLPTPRHLDLLSVALSDFLAHQPDRIALPVAETFAHERQLFDMASAPGAAVETEHMAWQGTMALIQKTVDVVRIRDRLGAREFTPSDVEMREHILCYWRPVSGSAVSLFEVDAATAAVLSVLRAAEGPEETLQRLAQSGLSQIGAEDLRATVIAAARRGLVELRGGWVP